MDYTRPTTPNSEHEISRSRRSGTSQENSKPSQEFFDSPSARENDHSGDNSDKKIDDDFELHTLSKKELEKKRREEKRIQEQLKKEEKKEKMREKNTERERKKQEKEKEKNEKKLHKKKVVKNQLEESPAAVEVAEELKQEEKIVITKKTEVQYYKEGPMDFYTPKGYKTYWFIVKDGLLMYFDSEKASDSDGLVDLHNCYLKNTTPENETKYKAFEIHHKENQQILLITNPPRDSESKKVIELDLFVLRLKANSPEASTWIKTIEDILSIQDQQDDPLFLPRHVNMKQEGAEEKCHWFNLFLNRYFYDLRNSETTMWMFLRIMTRKMERIRKPDWVVN